MNEKEQPNFDFMVLSSDVVPKSTPAEVVRKVHRQGTVDIEYAIWQPQWGATSCTIALHGFSRPLEDMLSVRPLLDDNTALLMPHLPAHGRSSGHHRPLATSDWWAALEGVLKKEGLHFNGTLIGYSLGGRVALTCFSLFPSRFTKVTLLAPDGLVKNPGYRFAVDTALGRAWMNQSERQRKTVVRVLNWLRAAHLLPHHIYQFFLFHLDSEEMWAMVIDCWCSLQQFWPPPQHRLRAISTSHNAVIEAHFGERDKVIKPANAKKLKGICPVHFHPCGHGLLRTDIIERIASPS